jgi:hypothetical protein
LGKIGLQDYEIGLDVASSSLASLLWNMRRLALLLQQACAGLGVHRRLGGWGLNAHLSRIV